MLRPLGQDWQVAAPSDAEMPDPARDGPVPAWGCPPAEAIGQKSTMSAKINGWEMVPPKALVPSNVPYATP